MVGQFFDRGKEKAESGRVESILLHEALRREPTSPRLRRPGIAAVRSSGGMEAKEACHSAKRTRIV